MHEFSRIKRLPPYVFAIVNDLKSKARARGEDVIDLGMGNPDQETPKHIVDKLVEAARNPRHHRYSASKGITRLRKAVTTWYRTRYGVELDPETEATATIGATEGMAAPAPAAAQPGHRGRAHRAQRRKGGRAPPGPGGAPARRRGAGPEPDVPDPLLLGRHRRRRPAIGAPRPGGGLLRPAPGDRQAGLAQGQAPDPLVPPQPDHRVRGPRLLREGGGLRPRAPPHGGARLRLRRLHLPRA